MPCLNLVQKEEATPQSQPCGVVNRGISGLASHIKRRGLYPMCYDFVTDDLRIMGVNLRN
jgi:hypothetical protein